MNFVLNLCILPFIPHVRSPIRNVGEKFQLWSGRSTWFAFRGWRL